MSVVVVVNYESVTDVKEILKEKVLSPSNIATMIGQYVFIALEQALISAIGENNEKYRHGGGQDERRKRGNKWRKKAREGNACYPRLWDTPIM